MFQSVKNSKDGEKSLMFFQVFSWKTFQLFRTVEKKHAEK